MFQWDDADTSPDLEGRNVLETFEMAILHTTRERVFWRWIYFHLRSWTFFWPSYGRGGAAIAPTAPFMDPPLQWRQWLDDVAERTAGHALAICTHSTRVRVGTELQAAAYDGTKLRRARSKLSCCRPFSPYRNSCCTDIIFIFIHP